MKSSLKQIKENWPIITFCLTLLYCSITTYNKVNAEETAHAALVTRVDNGCKEVTCLDKRVVATETNISNIETNINGINNKLDKVVTKDDLRGLIAAIRGNNADLRRN